MRKSGNVCGRKSSYSAISFATNNSSKLSHDGDDSKTSYFLSVGQSMK